MPDRDEKRNLYKALAVLLAIVLGVAALFQKVPAMQQWGLMVWGELRGVETKREICDRLLSEQIAQPWVLAYLAELLDESDLVAVDEQNFLVSKMPLGEYVYYKLLDLTDIDDLGYSFAMRKIDRHERRKKIRRYLQFLEEKGHFDPALQHWVLPEEFLDQAY